MQQILAVLLAALGFPPKPCVAFSAMEGTVDALGSAGRILVLARMFEEVQRQRFALDVEQTANDHGGDDPVAGSALGVDGSVTSYAARQQELDESEERLRERYASELPALHAYLAMRDSSREENK